MPRAKPVTGLLSGFTLTEVDDLTMVDRVHDTGGLEAQIRSE